MRRFAWFAFVLVLLVSPALVVSPASAAPMEARIRLHDGKLATADLSRVLLDNLHLKGMEFDAGSIDMTGLRGATFVHALNMALGEGCNVRVDDDALVLHIDPEKIPHDFDQVRAATRTFTAVAAPVATAAQRRFYGLLLPQQVDPTRPMVVLVHGLDCNRTNWFPMADLLRGEGYQVAFFTYPSDGPLQDSSAMLTRQMSALRDDFPSMPVHVLAHSMGGLIARQYVEGGTYQGGIGHLILIGTPNLGTGWAGYRWVLELQEHYGLWRHEKDWSPTWMITDGLGEAGRDIKPASVFLHDLNALPRREGVTYTVISGNQHPIYPMTARALDTCAKVIPSRAQNWWGFRQTESVLHRAADKLRHRTGKSDGPVTLKSTKLEGVSDQVILPVDHNALYLPVDGAEPAAWATIKDRLAH